MDVPVNLMPGLRSAIFGLGLSLAAAAAIAAPAGPMHEHAFSGTVTKLSPDSIELKMGTETFEFSRSRDMKEDLHIGDQVTIYTDLAVKRIKKNTKQEAGKKGKEILDDRAFYSASRGADSGS